MVISINNINIGDNLPFVLIAGPCVIENEEMVFKTAGAIKSIADTLKIPFIFKSSFKKANRTSVKSFSGLNKIDALKILQAVRKELNVPVLTDIHTEQDAELAAQYADILQIPAFLCRQTDLLIAAGNTGKIINIKKGQFLAPEDMAHAAEKVASTGNNQIMLTERGTTFGYHDLVVDMRSLVIMRGLGCPVVMDATHSVQIPSQGNVSGGQPAFIRPLAMAATAVGIDALFLEVYPDPKNALSDAGSQLPLDSLSGLIKEIKELDDLVKKKDDRRRTPYLHIFVERFLKLKQTLFMERNMTDIFMQAAIDEARKGLEEGGIPIGSVLVYRKKIIGRGHNRRVQKKSPILHGEMDALENAGRLPAAIYRKCTMYTTLSPCAMCSGAILLYNIPLVIIGENKTFLGEEELLRHRGVRVKLYHNEECMKLMEDFIRLSPQLWNEDIGELS